MGKKGDNKTTYEQRPLSSQELQLLQTQNKMMEAGIGVAQQQEDRSNAIYNDWKNNYLGIETGAISPTANRANGFTNDPYTVTADEYAQKKAEYEQAMAGTGGQAKPKGITGAVSQIAGSRGGVA